MPLKIDIADCSWEKLKRIAKKCDFYLSEGSKHTLVKTSRDGKKITTIPRHSKLNKWTAKEIIEALKKAGCNYKEISKF